MKTGERRSHFNFDLLVSYASTNGNSPWAYSYIKVAKGTNHDELKTSIDQIARDLLAEKYEGFQQFDHSLMAIQDIHLQSAEEYEMESNSSLNRIYILLSIGVLVLCLAAINYVNLNTAIATMRFKEIGVRKLLGCGKVGMIKQFIVETVLMSVITFIVAVGVFELIIPLFFDITGWDSQLSLLTRFDALFVVFILTLVVGLVAAAYPSFYLSSLRAHKGLKPIESGKTKLGMRGALVVFQFAISSLLIFGTLVINDQMDYINEVDLGFKKEHVIVVPVRNWNSESQYETLKSQWENLTAVEALAFASNMPTELNTMPVVKFWKAGTSPDEASLLYSFIADAHFVETLDIEIVHGRNFNSDLESDKGGFLVNEAAMNAFQLAEPVGVELESPYGKGKVLGVVKDFYFSSVHESIKPMVIYYGPNPTRMFAKAAVRLSSSDLKEGLESVRNVWNENQPGIPFEFTFLDEKINLQYRAEMQQNYAITSLSTVSIFISCLGILGLVAFTAQRKVKEIGIRKVLGARLASLLILIFSKFLLLLAIALVIALPLGYWFMNEWLVGFVERVNIGVSYFLSTMILIMVIAALTVFYHAYLAATRNPVNALRAE